MNVLLSVAGGSVPLTVVDGSGSDLGQGGIIAITSIALVFLMLSLIVLITWLVFRIISVVSAKAKPPVVPVAASAATAPEIKQAELSEDAITAALVASIDYRNETKKDIKVISIKEIK